MFSAIGRWIKAIGYAMTGRIDAARRVLDTNPHVIRAKYEEIIRNKKQTIQQYKRAVAGLITQQEKKLAKIKKLTEEVQKLEKLKNGALTKAKQSVKGKSKEDAQMDPTYKKCLSAYNDFSSTLTEKQNRINDLEEDIKEYSGTIAQHKTQLEHLLRDLENIKYEASDTVADVIAAKEENAIAESIAGISDNGSHEELESLRNMRVELKAEAKITKELAGSDLASQEAEFLEFASLNETNTEFDQLIGIASEKDNVIEEKKDREKNAALPE